MHCTRIYLLTLFRPDLSSAAVEVIGTVAACCTTIAFVPQLVRVWRRKSASDISLGMFVLFSFGELMWLLYGVLIKSLPVEAANALTLILALTILVLKLRYDRKKG